MKSPGRITADILVVDDHPHNLEVLRTVLEAEGHRVHVEQDGPSALRAAESMAFDLALIDIRMPQMDGYQVCEHLKSDPHTRDIPVIFLSALDDTSNKVQAFDSGGDDYIVKPFKVMEVIARVNNQLRYAAMHRQVQAKNDELRKRNAELLRTKGPEVRALTPGGTPLAFLRDRDAIDLFDGKYQLEEVIGHGGFGEVRRARHVVLGRAVAIKIIRPGQPLTSADAARVRLEGMSACRVEHPNAIAIWDAGVTVQGVIYLVMELLSGHSLRTELAKHGRLPVIRCLSIARTICDVLAAAHAAGVIHRDIKPDNIFLHVPREGEEVVKVVDFGIAKLIGESTSAPVTMDGQMIGTPEYLAPERLLGRTYDGRSDIYSLGCMMYEMLAGRVPFIASKEVPWMVATHHVGRDPESLQRVAPDVPFDVAVLVHEALTKQPENRPSATALLIMIERALSKLTNTEPDPAPSEDDRIVANNLESPTIHVRLDPDRVGGEKSKRQ